MKIFDMPESKIGEDEFVYQLDLRKPKYVLIGTYMGYTKKTKFICHDCGNEFERTPKTVMESHCPCPICYEQWRNVEYAIRKKIL